MDAAPFSKIVRFEASCANPTACYDIYRFGGCVAPGALGAATDRVYWGLVTPDNKNPTVRWREQDPSPVPLAGHTVVVADPTYAIVLGGQSSCSEDATFLDLTFFGGGQTQDGLACLPSQSLAVWPFTLRTISTIPATLGWWSWVVVVEHLGAPAAIRRLQEFRTRHGGSTLTDMFGRSD